MNAERLCCLGLDVKCSEHESVELVEGDFSVSIFVRQLDEFLLSERKQQVL